MFCFFGCVVWISGLAGSDKPTIQQEKCGGYCAYQVFQINPYPSKTLAALYCDEISKNHNFVFPDRIPLLVDFRISGYQESEKDDGGDFTNFKTSFERYCCLPVDPVDAFYDRSPGLKKLFYRIPVLKYLVSYWVNGAAFEFAVDTLMCHLVDCDHSRYPDITLNVLYSDDGSPTRRDAEVICAQLAQTGNFPSVQLVRIASTSDGKLVPELQSFDQNSIPDIVKSYEKRRWWLKNMWVSKLIFYHDSFFGYPRAWNAFRPILAAVFSRLWDGAYHRGLASMRL